MTSSIIDKARDLVEVTTGLGRIGASLVADRVRTAAGMRRARISILCGRCGIDTSVCTDDEDEPVCGDCAQVRLGDLARRLDTAAFHAMEARRERDGANARAAIAETALANLTRIHDEALAALSVAIQRAETAEAERDRTAKADREELRAWVESAAEKTRECEVMMAERNEYYTELAELRVNVMRLAKALWQRVRTDDHACGRCVEGGPIVRDGFVCAHHLAQDYLAIERERSAAAEVKS